MTTYSRVPYNPVNTDWYFSYINIPNLDIIKKELIRLLSLRIPKNHYSPFYVNISDIVQCPTFKKYLESVGLKEKLNRILFSDLDGPSVNDSLPHVDSTTPLKTFCYSLNIPLIDAEDSFTVWHKLKQGNEILTNLEAYSSVGWALKDEVQEIARMRYTQPALLNVSILHKGEAPSPSRVIAAIRFTPDLTVEEIDRLGVPIPLRQQS